MEISSAALSGLADKSNASATKVAEGYNQFLQLLTTQLQHQDPLDPMDSTEFTNQLVQFSQVEQSIIGNQKMDALLAMQNGSLLSASLQYIGKDVYFKGDSVYLNENKDPIRIGYTISDLPVGDAKLRIVDGNGVTVRTFSLDKNVTTSHVVWDGKDDEGNALIGEDGQPITDGVFQVKIDALDANNEALEAYTGVPAHVVGVETVNGTVMLSLDGDRQIAATDVLSVSAPENPTDTGSNTDDPDDEETTG
ncbi:MAG TPA: flagellar hook assembly protein FlgD [Alphaproteobacteria bacterium]